jgi:TatD DNase family protein
LEQLFELTKTDYLKANCKCELRTDDAGKSKGFAFLTVPAAVAAELLKLNGIDFYKQQLVIEESKTEESGKKKGGGQGKGVKGKGGQGNRGGQGRWRRNKNFDKFAMPKLDADQKFDICDCGANLTNPKFHNNLDLVIRHATETGVSKIVVTGLKLNGSKNAHTMAKNRNFVYAAVGIHPHFVKDDWHGNPAAMEEITILAKKDRVVAIGEVGLDYHRNYSEKEAMKTAFEAQVKIAVDNNKTLLVHDREASADVQAVLNKYHIVRPVVIYCMTGAVEQIKDYVSRGYYIGITGFICKEKHGQHIRDAITSKDLPLDKIMLHSDAPYMSPNGPVEQQDAVTKSLLDACFNGNEPCTLNIVVRQIADCLGMTPKDVAAQLVKNAEAIYNFKSVPDNKF